MSKAGSRISPTPGHLQGTATQSSTLDDAIAGRANDGKIDKGNHAFSRTTLERNPWWKLKLKDLGSSSGTHVNGSPASETRVGPGDVIQIGQTQLRIEGPGMAEQTVAAQATPAPAAAGGGAALVGTQIHHYEITRVLSQGSTSVVLHARDSAKNRDVALKVLLPELATDEE